MRLAAILSLSLLSLPAHAEDWIDFGMLMRDNAASVVTVVDSFGGTTEVLDFGNGVVVECMDRFCAGYDKEIPRGCLFIVMMAVTAVNSGCPGVLDKQQTETLQRNFARMGRFIEENAVPPRPAGYAQAMLEKEIVARVGDDVTPEKRAEQCKLLSPMPELVLHALVLEELTHPEKIAAFDEFLAEPRLPVEAEPCLFGGGPG